MQLTEAGIYGLDDLGGDVRNYYHDPAPGRTSLNQTLAKVLLNRSAMAAWYQHPGLNPDYKPPEPTDQQDYGTVSHFELMGVGRGFQVLNHDNYRTNVAKAERDALRAVGVIPILRKNHEKIIGMIGSLREALPLIADGTPFNSMFGEMEACALAYDPRGCWIRSLIDFYGYKCPSGVECWDYKTVSGSANPYAIASHASANGWAVQAAFQDKVLTLIKPHLSGKIAYRFLVQEIDPPYLWSVVMPSPTAFAFAQHMVEGAIAQWAECLRTKDWPGYPATPVEFGLLPSVEAQWLTRQYASADAPAVLRGTPPPPPPPPQPAPPARRRMGRRKSRSTTIPLSILPDEEVPF